MPKEPIPRCHGHTNQLLSISPKKPRIEIIECILQKSYSPNICISYIIYSPNLRTAKSKFHNCKKKHINQIYIIYNIFTQAEGAVRHLASREPNHDNNFGQVVMDLDCGDQEGVGHEGDPNKL